MLNERAEKLEKSERDAVELIFGGDISFRGLNDMSEARASEILSGVSDVLASADYRVMNLECPLADKEKHAPIVKSGPNHIYSPENVAFLKAAGVDLAILANNHIGDFGDGALLDTLSLLDENGIPHIGAGKNIEQAYAPHRFEAGGMVISIIAVCENEFGIALEDKPGSAGYTARRVYNRIREERAAADFVIVVFHGGCEFNPLPSPGTVDRYRMLCDMGADAVVAMHTHCPQGYELYDGKPIIYSLGNLLFKSGTWRSVENSWYYGYMCRLSFSLGRRIEIEPIPYKFDQDAERIIMFDGENKLKMLDYLSKLSQIIADPEQLRRFYLGWCRLHKWYAAAPKSDDDKPTGVYNLVTCESHHEMMMTNYRILLDGEQKLADEYVERIKELLVMPV